MTLDRHGGILFIDGVKYENMLDFGDAMAPFLLHAVPPSTSCSFAACAFFLFPCVDDASIRSVGFCVVSVCAYAAALCYLPFYPQFSVSLVQSAFTANTRACLRR